MKNETQSKLMDKNYLKGQTTKKKIKKRRAFAGFLE